MLACVSNMQQRIEKKEDLFKTWCALPNINNIYQICRCLRKVNLNSKTSKHGRHHFKWTSSKLKLKWWRIILKLRRVLNWLFELILSHQQKIWAYLVHYCEILWQCRVERYWMVSLTLMPSKVLNIHQLFPHLHLTSYLSHYVHAFPSF